MRFVLPNPGGFSVRDFMRKLNYQEHRDRHSKSVSYIRRAKPGGSFYPRYHVHVQNTPEGMFIDLHYDWRRPMHVKEARSADNRGDVIDKEVERMKQAAAQMAEARSAIEEEAPTKPKKKGLFGGMFGGGHKSLR
ncbi:hypothetical protein ACFL0Z_00045 [Patescibacteria group bacterium]